jgi:uncharacterized membrane protein
MATEQVSVESVVDDGWTNAGREWRDPANWHWGFYSAPNDPRIWVRKRTMHFGWTFNYAHRASWYWTAAMLAVAFAAMAVSAWTKG